MSAITYIAALMQEMKKPGSLAAGAKRGAQKAGRARVDAHFNKVRAGKKPIVKSTPSQIKTKKAAGRRKEIMERAAPAGSGYWNLIRALGDKKKKD